MAKPSTMQITKTFREYLAVHPLIQLDGHAMDEIALGLAHLVPACEISQIAVAGTATGRTAQADTRDAERYRWLRSRDLEAISQGGVFAGMTPQNVILNEEDLDQAVDAAIAAAKEGGAA